MTSVEKFKSLNPDLLHPHRNNRIKGKKVIKRRSVDLDKPIKIDIPDEKIKDGQNSVVTPITENGEIVGILHRCKCGEKSEIYFELEEEVKKQ